MSINNFGQQRPTAPPIGLPPKGVKFCHTSNILLVGRLRRHALLWLYFNSSAVSCWSVHNKDSRALGSFPSKRIKEYLLEVESKPKQRRFWVLGSDPNCGVQVWVSPTSLRTWTCKFCVRILQCQTSTCNAVCDLPHDTCAILHIILLEGHLPKPVNPYCGPTNQ